MDFCIDNNLKHWLTQGLDVRFLNKNIAKKLKEVKRFKPISFAWDFMKLEPIILKKIELLRNVGFNLKNDIQFYVYVDSDKEFDSGLYRCNKLRDLKVNSFVMFNVNEKRSNRIKDLQRWANRKPLYWGCNFDEYKRR